MYFKKNWGSMTEKEPLFGYVDIFQTSPRRPAKDIQKEGYKEFQKWQKF